MKVIFPQGSPETSREPTVRIVFGKQLTFGFDDQDQRSCRELIACVDFHSAKGDDIMLATLVDAGNRPPGVSRDKTVGLIADLIRDDQIRLTIGEKHPDKVAMLAVLAQPDQWLDVVVIRAAVVDPAMLAKAGQAAAVIFAETVPPDHSPARPGSRPGSAPENRGHAR
jgi:hypothetical protein